MLQHARKQWVGLVAGPKSRAVAAVNHKQDGGTQLTATLAVQLGQLVHVLDGAIRHHLRVVCAILDDGSEAT
jgi:hypothetical protein